MPVSDGNDARVFQVGIRESVGDASVDLVLLEQVGEVLSTRLSLGMMWRLMFCFAGAVLFMIYTLVVVVVLVLVVVFFGFVFCFLSFVFCVLSFVFIRWCKVLYTTSSLNAFNRLLNRKKEKKNKSCCFFFFKRRSP